jgi:delta 1-pyrroline-5-carboxylate dehydrogenase
MDVKRIEQLEKEVFGSVSKEVVITQDELAKLEQEG